MVGPIRERVHRDAFLQPHKRTGIKRSKLWNEVAIYGAIALVVSKLKILN